ncbi:MAG TPA: PTS sugar transporter subunit IIA [Pirellulales bacterium]|jgi:PTS system nitrogen regulatory IIA component|nr:PTS sugar transporter subunit IIA [Pirellulales bacterium]
MADGDFGIESLAEYLHLNPEQVARLAERGKLPGRQVGGQWRFSRPDIVIWLEERIGLSDDAELATMEHFLRRPTPADPDRPHTLAEMLPPEAIAIPLLARTRSSVISSMAELAAQTGWLWDPQRLAEAIREREEMNPTALESGVALLHPRRPQSKILGQSFLALGITQQGIPFGGARGSLTDVFFLVCSLDDRGHLRTLARLSRILSQPNFLPALRGAADVTAARDLIAAAEAKVD